MTVPLPLAAHPTTALLPTMAPLPEKPTATYEPLSGAERMKLHSLGPVFLYLRTKSCCFQAAVQRKDVESKGTRLATATLALAHESAADSWWLSATQNPSRQSSSSSSRRTERVPEEAAIAVRCSLPVPASGCVALLDLAGAGTRLVRRSEGKGWMATGQARAGPGPGGQFGRPHGG